MKAVIVHFVLAVVGLGAAYNVWRAPEGSEGESQSIVVVSCEPERLASVSLTTEKGVFTIEKKSEGEDSYWWGSATRTPEKGEPTSKHFALSKKVEDYFKVAAPMRAVRGLGKIDETLAKEIELAEAKTALTIKCANETHTFDVGTSASGSGDRYMRKQGGGPVYLVRKELVEDIERAESKLMQRKLTAHEDRDVETLAVSALGREAKLLHHNRLEPGKGEWVNAAKPDQRNELYGNWLSRLGRLSISEYLTPDQKPGDEKDGKPAPRPPASADAGVAQAAVEPAEKSLTTVATFRYLNENGEEVDQVELAKLGTTNADYYARSTTTRAWVRVLNSIARQAENDLPMIVGIEEIPDKPAAPKPAELPTGHPPI